MARGDRSEPGNTFRWDKIRLNLPGDSSYPPKITWVSKFQGETQELAFLDDYRVAAGSAKETWGEAHRVGPIWKYLGLKDAP